MDVEKLFRLHGDVRITLGNLWVVYDDMGKYTVYERRKYQKNTRTVGMYKNLSDALDAMAFSYLVQ